MVHPKMRRVGKVETQPCHEDECNQHQWSGQEPIPPAAILEPILGLQGSAWRAK